MINITILMVNLKLKLGLTHSMTQGKDTHPMENCTDKLTKPENSMLLVSNKQ